MFLHSFSLVSWLPKSDMPYADADHRTFFSTTKTMLSKIGRFAIWCVLACISAVSSSVGAIEASTSSSLGSERIEEEMRRGQRYGSRLTHGNIAAWQQGNNDWLHIPASGPTHGNGEASSISSAAYTSDIGVESFVSSDFPHSEGVRNRSVSAHSVNEPPSDGLLSIPFNALLEHQHQPQQNVPVAHQSSAMIDAVAPSSVASRSAYSAQSVTSHDTESDVSAVSDTHASSWSWVSAASEQSQSSERNNAMASQHDGGMHLITPMISQSGSVEGGGEAEGSASHSSISMRSHSVSNRTDSSEHVSTYASSDKSESTHIPTPPSHQILVKGSVIHTPSDSESKSQNLQKSTSSFTSSTASRAASAIRLQPSLDQQVLQLGRRIDHVERAAHAGIAAAMAMPNLAPSEPGKTTVAVGTANFRGESAIGVGLTHRSAGGSMQFNVAVSGSSGAVGVRAQAGYEF